MTLIVDGDLLTREYRLQYEQVLEKREASLILEVVDDGIAENEEIFIIYTSVVEDPGDICARAVRLRDNDGEKINSCTYMDLWASGAYLSCFLVARKPPLATRFNIH